MPDYTHRDFRQGRYSKNSISPFLIPENSVSHSLNVNFDEIIGSAKVRAGTVKLGDTVASGQTPRGLGNFVGKGGTPNILEAAYSDGNNTTIYYFDEDIGFWQTTDLTNLDPDVKNRFAVLGGSVFVTNSVDGMFDSPDGAAWGTTNSINTGTIFPSLVFRYKGRLLAAGDPTYPSRVWFSSIIDPTASPFITWNTNPTTGDWIDINPDDGGFITGFSESSTFCLVLKSTGMYRLDTLSKTTDAENIFDIGAINQECIVLCRGVSYYFSGQDMLRTNGGYPEQISRAGVQDYIDAIPLANWEDVAGGTDGLACYWSIGDVTVNNKDYTNVVLKYSTRDQTWSVHSYSKKFKFFASYVTTVTTL